MRKFTEKDIKGKVTNNMNINKTLTLLLVCSILLLPSCGEKHETPMICIETFIKSAQEHDMAKAWNTLSPEAQAFYNDLGIKNRKSGRGILEHDINEVKKFKTLNSGYKLEALPNDKNKVSLISSDGEKIIIETVNNDGTYRLKNAETVRNILKGIAEEIVKKEYY